MSSEKILPLMVIHVIFNVPDKLKLLAVENSAGPEGTPKSDLNLLIALERNSYNFLE